MKPPEPNSEPEPPAPDRYELTLRLEKGDTVDKMLADIDVPQADRKQIHERLAALLKKKRLAAGEEIEILLQNAPEHPPHQQSDARPVVLGASTTGAGIHHQPY